MIDTGMDERVKLLQVNVVGQPSGQLLQQSGFEYRYLQVNAAQPAVGLLMPPTPALPQAADDRHASACVDWR